MFVLHWDETKYPVYKRCPDFRVYRVSCFQGVQGVLILGCTGCPVSAFTDSTVHNILWETIQIHFLIYFL